MKYQSLFSGQKKKKKENISKCRLLKVFSSRLSAANYLFSLMCHFNNIRKKYQDIN